MIPSSKCVALYCAARSELLLHCQAINGVNSLCNIHANGYPTAARLTTSTTLFVVQVLNRQNVEALWQEVEAKWLRCRCRPFQILS